MTDIYFFARDFNGFRPLQRLKYCDLLLSEMKEKSSHYIYCANDSNASHIFQKLQLSHSYDLKTSDRLNDASFQDKTISSLEYNKVEEARWHNNDIKSHANESLNEVKDRTVELVNEIIDLHNSKAVIISSYTLNLACLLDYYGEKMSYEEYIEFRDKTPIIVRFRYDGRKLEKLDYYYF